MEQWQEIRGGIEKNLGRRVWMRSHRGRSKCVENVGILRMQFSQRIHDLDRGTRTGKTHQLWIQ